MAAPLNGSSVLVLVRTAGPVYVGEAYGTGDGTTTTFAHTMANIPVLPGSVTITAGTVVATDDGDGNLTGSGVSSGSIDYTTGAATITYSTAPADGTPITADYSQLTQVTGESYGTGDGTTTTFSHTIASTPVLLGSVTITAGSVVATDDGLGNLVGTDVTSGSIDYDTGASSITYETAPADDTAITASYTHAFYTAVGSQSDATFDEKTNAIEVSAKNQRQAQYLPGKYTASITMSHLYVPSDAAFAALKSAMRSGTKIVVARQELGSETEHASAVITELSGSFKDQTEGVVSVTITVDGPWMAA